MSEARLNLSLMGRYRGWMVRILLTLLLLALLVLDVTGRIKVDGWAIFILLAAAAPWSVPGVVRILDAVTDALGRLRVSSMKIGGFEFKMQQLEIKVTEQAHKIDEQRRLLDDLTIYSLSYYIYDKLKFIHLGISPEYPQYAEYLYKPDEPTIHDLRYLRDHGYLEMFQFDQLIPGENLVGKLKPTEMGCRFVDLKEAGLK